MSAPTWRALARDLKHSHVRKTSDQGDLCDLYVVPADPNAERVDPFACLARALDALDAATAAKYEAQCLADALMASGRKLRTAITERDAARAALAECERQRDEARAHVARMTDTLSTHYLVCCECDRVDCTCEPEDIPPPAEPVDAEMTKETT